MVLSTVCEREYVAQWNIKSGHRNRNSRPKYRRQLPRPPFTCAIISLSLSRDSGRLCRHRSPTSCSSLSLIIPSLRWRLVSVVGTLHITFGRTRFAGLLWIRAGIASLNRPLTPTQRLFWRLQNCTRSAIWVSDRRWVFPPTHTGELAV